MIKDKQIAILFFAFIILIISACNSVYTSKKRGYFHIDLPEHSYTPFEKPGFPYTFMYPQYATIVQDTTYFDSKPENDFWINVDFPQFGARVFLSYKIIGGNAPYKVKNASGGYSDSLGINQFDHLVNDAFNLTNKNEVVATSIRDSLFTNSKGVSGVAFTVGGNAATPLQFFMSDTSRHFIRGALYFATTPNADSIKPVQQFLQEDIHQMINTFQWKE